MLAYLPFGCPWGLIVFALWKIVFALWKIVFALRCPLGAKVAPTACLPSGAQLQTANRRGQRTEEGYVHFTETKGTTTVS